MFELLSRKLSRWVDRRLWVGSAGQFVSDGPLDGQKVPEAEWCPGAPSLLHGMPSAAGVMEDKRSMRGTAAAMSAIDLLSDKEECSHGRER